jgi:serine O-acetyltransferase
VNLLQTIASDLRAPVERDPAARGVADVILSYPGFHAITAYRLIHPLHELGIPLLPRFLAHLVRGATGIEIHPGAKIGKGFFIDHGMGVVIGETAEIGDDVTLYQGVTIGGTSLSHGKRHATLRDRVVVGSNASVLGNIVVGSDSRVGAGSVVTKDVPPDSTVIGVPARLVVRNGERVRSEDVTRVDMPDPQDALIAKLADRVEALEQKLAELAARGSDRGASAL